MKIRILLPAGLLLAGLLVAGCDSSGSSPTGPSTGDPDSKEATNGSLVIAGKTLPVNVGGIYDDTSMLISVGSNTAGSSDTGWIVMITAKPGKNSLALVYNPNVWIGNTAQHDDFGSPSFCAYHITAGNLHIDSWSETQYTEGKLAKLSGGASMTLTPDSSSTACAAVSAALTFTDASAGHP